MRMNGNDIKKYPKCTKLLQGLEKDLMKQPKVLKAWLDACTADVQRQDPKVAKRIALTQALKWNAGPMIDVRPGMIKIPGSDGDMACGYQPPFDSGKNFLWITSFWFDGFEYCLMDYECKKNAHRLTTTVLHESVHWVRQEARAYDDVEDKDAGDMFEKWAFGKSVCTNDDVLEAMLSIRR
jgi:hypothetical protein